MKTTLYHIKTEEKADGSKAFQLVDTHGDIDNTLLTPEIVAQLSRCFNGAAKYVSRSSGGMSLVTPVPILVVQHCEGKTEIRTRVVFRELERNAQHRLISKKIVFRSKNVLLGEIKERPLESSSQIFETRCIDFGMGIIPVCVFKFHEDPDGVIWALFVRYDELERALVQGNEESLEISVYKVPRDLLRYMDSVTSSIDKNFLWAQEHAQKLLARGEVLIPEFLRAAPSFSLIGGKNLQEIKARLELALIQGQSLPTPIFYVDSEALAPLDEN